MERPPSTWCSHACTALQYQAQPSQPSPASPAQPASQPSPASPAQPASQPSAPQPAALPTAPQLSPSRVEAGVLDDRDDALAAHQVGIVLLQGKGKGWRRSRQRQRLRSTHGSTLIPAGVACYAAMHPRSATEQRFRLTARCHRPAHPSSAPLCPAYHASRVEGHLLSRAPARREHDLSQWLSGGRGSSQAGGRLGSVTPIPPCC